MSDSSASNSSLAPRWPVSGVTTVTAGDGTGVTAVVRDGVGLATVLARRGAAEALGRRVSERFGLELPNGPRRSSTSETAFAGTAPGTWLAASERGGNEFAAALARDFEGMASVSDQSDGYTLIRLSGPRVRDTLAKLVPLDLHPRAFRVGDVAASVADHMSVTLWRLADESGGAPVFEVVMFRSLARSFWHALTESAAEYGFSGRGP